MGVSFKVAKAGKRYRPKVVQSEDKENDSGGSGVVDDNRKRPEEQDKFAETGEEVVDCANLLVNSGLHSVPEDMEVSFTLNLFPEGYFVGKNPKPFNDGSMKLYPFNRASETLFTSIEYGWLPRDLFDGVPCKFVNGALLCEIKDYRHSFKTSNTVTSPTVHKVLLQMSMENVIKDISSASDDSWTYNDILEVESRILKALQPELNLDPQPLLGKSCGKPLKKKLDLGITWPHKRRKVIDSRATDLSFNYQHRGNVPCSQHDISSYNSNIQKVKLLAETISLPTASRIEQYYPLADNGRHPISVGLTSANISPVPIQSLVPFRQHPCERQPVTAAILNTQKKHPQSQSEIETKKICRERFLNRQGSSFLSPSYPINGQLPINEGRNVAITVKQEPAETVGCQSNHLQELSRVLAINLPNDGSAENRKIQEKKAGKEVGSRKRKVLQNSSTNLGVISRPVNSSQNVNSQKKAPEPAKRKKNSLLKDTVSTQSGNGLQSGCTQNGSCLQLGPKHLNLHQTSEDKGISILERFSKIEQVTKRHGLLNNRKQKSDNILPQKLPFLLSQLVGSCLWSSEDNAQQTNGEWMHGLNQLANGTFNAYKTRILNFVRQCHLHQGNGIPIVDSRAHVQLVMTKWLNEGIVEGKVRYANEEGMGFTDFTPLPTFPSIPHADLYASQFTSLMLREGYYPVTIGKNPGSSYKDISSSTKQSDDTQAATSSSGLLALSFMSPPQSHPFLTDISGQLPSNMEKLRSMQQLLESNVSNFHDNVAAQVSRKQQHWQQLYNQHVQLQMMQKYKLSDQTVQGMAMAGGMGSGVHGNIAHDSSGDTSVVGPNNAPMGVLKSSFSNLGQFGNIGSDIPNSAAVLANMKRAEMAYLLSKPQISPQNLQLQQLQSMLQPSESKNSVTPHMGYLPHSQVDSQLIDQKPQLIYTSTPQQMNNRGTLPSPRNSEVSSRTHSGSASSSRKSMGSQRPKVQQTKSKKKK